MPRPPRADEGGGLYHALNRANLRAEVFHKDADYEAFERILGEGLALYDVQLFSYQLMPNHWHLVLRPNQDGEMSRFLRWITATHTMRYHVHNHSSGTGHVYQGRFKSFPVQDDEHFLTVCRYVERNARRANLVTRAEDSRRGLALGIFVALAAIDRTGTSIAVTVADLATSQLGSASQSADDRPGTDGPASLCSTRRTAGG